MKNNNIDQFYTILKNEMKNGEMVDLLNNIRTEDDLRNFICKEILPIANKNGYDFTVDDIINHEKKSIEMRELTDDELDEIVGGAIPRALLLSMPLMALMGSISIGGPKASAMNNSSTALSGMSSSSDSIVQTVSQEQNSVSVDEVVKNMLDESQTEKKNSIEKTTETKKSDENSEKTSINNEKTTETKKSDENSEKTSINNEKTTETKKIKEEYDSNGKMIYSNIMRKAAALNPNFGNTKITEIAMLGAHDALTSKIDNNSEVSDFPTAALKNNAVKKIGNLIGLNQRYAKTQTGDARFLLDSGARMLDVRVTTKGQEFKTYHSVISGNLEDSLKEIIEFLLDNPGEFVVFHIGNYQSKDMPDTINLAKYISSVTVNRDGKSYNLYSFINYDADQDTLSDLTYNKVTANGSKGGVYISMDNKVREISSDDVCPTNGVQYKKLLNREVTDGAWLNSQNTAEIMNQMTEKCENAEKNSPSKFRMCQYQTSPDTKEIITNGILKGGSLLSNAEKHNASVINDARFDENMKKCPICWFDNISTTEGGFNSRVNEKILQYNLNLNNNSSGLTANTSYTKVSSVSSLKDNMKIVLQNSDECTLVKSGNKWKIMRSDGKYLKRKGTSISPKLSTTSSEKDATAFSLSEVEGGKIKITEGSYSLVFKGSSATMQRGADKATAFDLLVCQ